MDGNVLFSYPALPSLQEPTNNGRFVGRQQELNQLSKIIQSRTSASVLVAGYRGAGKTALVEKALADSTRDRIVVRLTPPHIHDSDTEKIRSQVLRSLARGLHFAVGERDDVSEEICEQLEEIYDKTYLSELEQHSVIETLSSAERTSSRNVVIATQFEPSQTTKFLLGATGTALVGSLGIGTVLLALEDGGWIAAVIVGIALAVMAVVAGLKIEQTESRLEQVIKLISEKGSSSKVGRYDLSAESLEFELRAALRALKRDEHSVVFLIDELDKLNLLPKSVVDLKAEAAEEKQSASDEVLSHPVFLILASLKNFFTAGDAVHIFITDDEFWKRTSHDSTKSYAASYTIFTDRIFVGKLGYEAIESLIDSSVQLPDSGGSESYEQFKNFVCWESGQHVFAALQLLASFVEVIDVKEQPSRQEQLVVRQSGIVEGRWKEGNIAEDWLTKAALQKHLGVAYDEARRTGFGTALFNEALWDNLHETCAQLLAWETLTVRSDEYIKLPRPTQLSEDEKNRVAQAVERLLARLARRDAATVATTEEPAEGDNEPVELVKYSLNRDVPYPDSSIAKDTTLLAWERALSELVKHLSTMAVHAEHLVTIPDDTLAEIEKVKSIDCSIRDVEDREFLPKPAVLRAIQDAHSLTDKLLRFAVTEVVQNWAAAKESTPVSTLNATHPKTRQPWNQFLRANFEPLLETLVGGAFHLIGENASENAILVLPLTSDAFSKEVADAYTQCMSDSEEDRRLRSKFMPVISIVLDAGQKIDLPTEVVDSLDPGKNQGMIAQFLGGLLPKATEVRAVAGFSQFPLKPDLSNLSDLSDALTSHAHLSRTL